MPYHFFFSYKRVSKTAYQRKFFDDLSDELRDLLEISNKDEPVGFFDQSGIEPGEEWESVLENALQESKVMVCMYSPKYFESEYCGKEWQVFNMRRQEYQRQRSAAGEMNPPLPVVIRPVLWLPLPDDLDPDFKRFQIFKGTREDVANREGLLYVLKRRTDFRKLYADYITNLARGIKEAVERYDLPPLPNLPPLAEIPSAFAKPVAPAPQPPEQPQPEAPRPAEVPAEQIAVAPELPLPEQPQPAPALPPAAAEIPGAMRSAVNIRFIFVAGDPARFGSNRQKQAYLDRGGSDWKPFYPTPSDRIGRMIQRFVANEDVEYDIDIMQLGEDLISVVQQAYQDREIVVIIVDAWTLSWDADSRNILSQFDQTNRMTPFYNCSVLVPWNEADLEIKDERNTILDTVRATFDSRVRLFNNPSFYRDSITSVEHLFQALRDALTNIRSDLHGRAEGQKPVTAGISKPIVSNESTPTERRV
jgi:FxsC-like protein